MPCNSHRNRFATKLMTGCGLIALGLVYALQNLGVVHLGGILHFWPLALLLLALVSFANRGPLAFGGHVLLLGAVALQIKSLGQRELLAQWWPVGLIWLGVVMVLRSFHYRRHASPFASCQDSCERPS